VNIHQIILKYLKVGSFRKREDLLAQQAIAGVGRLHQRRLDEIALVAAAAATLDDLRVLLRIVQIAADLGERFSSITAPMKLRKSRTSPCESAASCRPSDRECQATATAARTSGSPPSTSDPVLERTAHGGHRHFLRIGRRVARR